MSQNDSTPRLQIHLDAETRELFERYRRFTGVGAEDYVQELIRKTQPTLKAIVGAFEQAGGDADKLMELFGRNMGEAVLAEQARD